MGQKKREKQRAWQVTAWRRVARRRPLRGAEITLRCRVIEFPLKRMQLLFSLAGRRAGTEEKMFFSEQCVTVTDKA